MSAANQAARGVLLKLAAERENRQATLDEIEAGIRLVRAGVARPYPEIVINTTQHDNVFETVTAHHLVIDTDEGRALLKLAAKPAARRNAKLTTDRIASAFVEVQAVEAEA